MLSFIFALVPFFNFVYQLCVNRTDSGPEDRDSEEGGTAVLYADVHGLSTLLHLPHEVCFTFIFFDSCDDESA